MGCDWYSIFCVYGYNIIIPKGINYHKYLLKLQDLDIKQPFGIESLISDFHSRLEGCDMDDISYLDKYANIVLGFIPSDDLNETLNMANQLKEYITDNPDFKDIQFSEKPGFYSGDTWDYTTYIEDESDEDEEDESEDEDDNN